MMCILLRLSNLVTKRVADISLRSPLWPLENVWGHNLQQRDCGQQQQSLRVCVSHAHSDQNSKASGSYNRIVWITKISNFYFRVFEANWSQFSLQSLIWGHPYSNVMSHWGLRPWGQRCLRSMQVQILGSHYMLCNKSPTRTIFRLWPLASETNWINSKSTKILPAFRICPMSRARSQSRAICQKPFSTQKNHNLFVL